ncbi:MAG: hypothetical protein C3F15_15630 [Holophagae bacterium]|nr:MAG: hypothetical protein C3F15_15630 [Holophagae bacterium]
MSLHRLTGLVASVAASIWLAAGCGRPAKPADSAPGAATKPGAFPREQLIEDTRELAAIIEDTHPDPYSGGGGRIGFHRRLHQALNAIPDDGMTKDEFYRLLRPFVAGVGDAHTNFLHGFKVDHDRPGGVPLRLKVVEESLVVVGVERPNQALLGSRLVSVEGVALAELVERQRRLRGIDNQYHALYELATRSLPYRAYLQDLIPEWKDTARVRVELQRPDSSTAVVELQQPGSQPDEVRPRSRVVLPPVSGEAGFETAFLRPPDGGEEVAYVRFTHMGGYRETLEQRDPILTKVTRPPSATAELRELVVEMKQRGTRALLLDVRGNPGGNSLISEILVYYLYGREQLLKMAGVGTGEHGAFRYSRLYFADRPNQSLAVINEGRAVPLVEGDYDFAWSYVDGTPIARRSGPAGEPPMVKFLRRSPTFRTEYDAGTYSGHYKPGKVIVLCDAGTLSAGFSVVVEFWRLGATTVGTPPAQAPNSYGAAVIGRLRHTGIEVMVPTISAAHFPDDPSKAKVLPVDHLLTYERFASYGFDPNAEYLYALTLL